MQLFGVNCHTLKSKMGTNPGSLGEETRQKVVYQVNGADSMFQERSKVILSSSPGGYTPSKRDKDTNVSYHQLTRDFSLF